MQLAGDSGLKFFQEMLRTGRLTEKSAGEIAAAGARLKLDAPCDWHRVEEQFRRQGSLDDETVEQIRDFTQAAQAQQRALRKKVKADEASKLENQQFFNVSDYLLRVEKLCESYKEVSSQTAVAAIAGASFGPLATLSAYLAWNPAPKKHVQSLVTQLQQLIDGKSPLQSQGNRVRPVPQEKLWQAKIQLLEKAAASARAGHPVEIDAQYFEMTSSSFVGKLAEAARAGCPVRINVDPSRAVSPNASEMSVDDGPRKLRALLQMSTLPNVAISVYPVARQLGNLDELMHRKLLRVGDTVLLGGMNANEGSGENYDTGYLIEGPAARGLVEGFRADLAASAGVTPEDVYGAKKVNAFLDGKVCLTPHGLLTTFDALSGPSPAGTRIAAHPTLAELQAGAEKLGVSLGDLLAIEVEDLGKKLKHGSNQPVELTEAGKQLLGRLVERTFQQMGRPENQKQLADVQMPQAPATGPARVAVGGPGEAREAMMLQAVSSAEKFLYAPTFVITKAVARAIVARRDELAARGQTLDVRVVADAGVYGYGGTPNEEGVTALEDAGIPVHWALLTRSEGDHDRKIHAKQVLTDKMELIGSTNLSNKGIRDNWELSGLIYFERSESEARQDSQTRFLKLWEHESIALDSLAAARKLLGPEANPVDVEQARPKAIRTFLGAIQNYEAQSARFIDEQCQDERIAARALELQKTGMAFGYSRLAACQEVLGEKAFYARLEALPARQKLAELSAP